MKYLLYKLSVFLMLSSQGLDTASSWGKHENNRILASRDGRFGAKGVSIKVGVVSGLLAGQRLTIKKRPLTRRYWTTVNLVMSGVTIPVSVRNLTIDRRTEGRCK